MVVLQTLLGLYAPVVLASGSPRRKYLLEQIGLGFTVYVSAIQEEAYSTTVSPEEYVQTLAFHKALDVARKLDNPAIVIGADTTVVLDGEILNKPVDEADAVHMLTKLSGRTHTVYTGLALVDAPSEESLMDVQRTDVTFRQLSKKEIHAYVVTGSPLDKAGAYGIQDDFGAVFVQSIKGCYYNVVGLPLELLYRKLEEFCMIMAGSREKE